MTTEDREHATLRIRELLDQRGIKWYDVPAYGRSYHITRWMDSETGYVYEVTRLLGIPVSNQVELLVHNGSGTSTTLCVLPEEVLRIATDERLAAAYGVL